MDFWQGFLFVSILAAVFILWPTFFVQHNRKKELREGVREDANAEVIKDHIKDLSDTHGRGEIGKQEFESLKSDLERTLIVENSSDNSYIDRPIVSNLKSRLPVISLAFAIPLACLILYTFLGAKDDLAIRELATARMHQTSEERKESGAKLVELLQKRVHKKPKNIDNWYTLATTAMNIGKYSEAVHAYRKVLELQPEAPRIMAELAQALYLRAGNSFTPEVREYTEKALSMNPHMPTALGLSGIDDYQSGRYEEAIAHWENAIKRLNPRSTDYQVLTSSIANAKKAMGQNPSKKPEEKTEWPKISLKVAVKLNKGLSLEKDDTVFIYARAFQGPKMPLAIQKLKVSDLPATITLDQSMAMAPGMDLSTFPQVELVARVSSSGSAIPKSGDWQAAIGPVIVAEQKKAITLSDFTQIP